MGFCSVEDDYAGHPGCIQQQDGHCCMLDRILRAQDAARLETDTLDSR